MRIRDIEFGKYYRVSSSHSIGIPVGTILLGTQDDFVMTDEIEWDDSGVSEEYELIAVVVHSPSDTYKPGYTLYRSWDDRVEVSEISLHLEGIE